MFQTLRKYIQQSKNIRFEGNGYSDEWKKEAQKRGLHNVPTTPGALDFFVSKKPLALFEKLHILTHREQEARYDIFLETYTKKIQIESRIIADMVNNQIIPAAIAYQKNLVDNLFHMKSIMSPAAFKKASEIQMAVIEEISERTTIVRKSAEQMRQERKKANALSGNRKQAEAYCQRVKPFFDTIRYQVDKLEYIVDDQIWPLPKYREMLYLR